VPVGLLLLAYAGWAPLAWLVRAPEGEEWRALAGALPVVRAMLIGTLLAAAVGWREIQPITRSLFEGMGFAYANIISLTITAQCFGAGIAAIGVSDALLKLLDVGSSMALLLAGGIPWALAVLSGSGSGPILTFAQTFLAHVEARHDPVTLGAVACLAGAFGRTMSPVAAVVIYSSGLVGVSPLPLIRQLLPALLAGAVTALALAALPAWR
jgi:C4-dicarboxylate transporter, DcuC family